MGIFIRLLPPISPGSSGSLVVNTNGEVIGIATFYLVEGQNLNFAIPGERITKLQADKGRTLNEWSTANTEKKPDSAEVLFSTGFVFFLADDYKKALSYFEKVGKKIRTMQRLFFKLLDIAITNWAATRKRLMPSSRQSVSNLMT